MCGDEALRGTKQGWNADGAKQRLPWEQAALR
jgi:hypothetical protein